MNTDMVKKALTSALEKLSDDLNNPQCDDVAAKANALLAIESRLSQIELENNNPLVDACFAEMQKWFSLADVWRNASQIAAAISLSRKVGEMRSEAEMRQAYGDLAFIKAKRMYIEWYDEFVKSIEKE
jgi:hypothetical protein